MKKLILSMLILTITQITFAQNTIAKFKFEEAEQAFVNNNYKQTISKLDEAETLLESTNPKIIHLKILAQYKLIEENPYDDFKIVESAKKLSANYLKEYESLPSNEDKYREIYTISEHLKNLPNTIQEFNNKKKEKLGEEENKKINKIISEQKASENFKNFVFYSDFKIGLTLDETYKLYPDFKKNYKVNDKNELIIIPKNYTNEYQPSGIYVKNDIVYGYYINFYTLKVDDDKYTLGTDTTNKILERLNNEFQFSPVEEITEKTEYLSGEPFLTKTINYTWSKNNKTIILSFTKIKYQGVNEIGIGFNSKDLSLIK